MAVQHEMITGIEEALYSAFDASVGSELDKNLAVLQYLAKKNKLELEEYLGQAALTSLNDDDFEYLQEKNKFFN